MKECVFCEQTLLGTASKEHILPEWLLNEFSIRKEQISPTHFSQDGIIVSTRSHQLKKLVAGGICESCNNGWMSELEILAKPILLDLFSTKHTIAQYNQEEQLIVARWAMKTALTLNLGANFHKNIPKSHYTHIYKDIFTLPDKTAVFAQNHHFDQNFYWVQAATWITTAPDNTLDEKISYLKTHSYKIGFQLRGLLIVVAFNPLDDFLFCLWRGIHVPLYPRTGRIASYDRENFPWSNSKEALFSFHLGLELIRDSS